MQTSVPEAPKRAIEMGTESRRAPQDGANRGNSYKKTPGRRGDFIKMRCHVAGTDPCVPGSVDVLRSILIA